MDRCLECTSKRLAEFSAKLTEGCQVYIGERQYEGHLPDDLNIGDTDTVSFIYCLDCGMLQDDWPLDSTMIEDEEEDEEEDS